MSGCRLSVVVPIFNGLAYLEDCLDSILGQLADDCECVVVDDWSDADTVAALKRYEAAHAAANLRVVYAPHGGASHARNLGLEAARGKFYGKGYKITGLNVDAPPGSSGTYDNRGLFGCVEGGTLQGVKVSETVKGSSNVGGLVGYVKGSTVIENCEADVDVSGYNYLGGLVGKVEGPVRITGSKARGSVTGCNYLAAS